MLKFFLTTSLFLIIWPIIVQSFIKGNYKHYSNLYRYKRFECTIDNIDTSSIKAIDENLVTIRSILLKAANERDQEPNSVIDALLKLEKLMRSKNKLDNFQTSKSTLSQLNGSWRLIFTTGTVSAQKVGKINYFPLKAIQSFNTESLDISNGVYFNDWTIIKFNGNFDWVEKPRKLVFDFDEVEVFGLKFNLPKPSDTKKNKVKPFFNWISADSDIATARGGSGGLALWKRVV